ncbi:MAG: KdsC family phosphatase [Planctomycetota bacterium]|jgi:3-deoxy-D-manno-octulosonate 8-phosphate phosphatase (KDO 8-P phosphatase)
MSQFDKIELLVLDVDGVLTDGGLIVNSDGTESKTFNALDGHGIRMWRRAGLKVAFLSGRCSAPTEHFASGLDVEYCIQNCHIKLDSIKQLLEQANITPDKVAFVGDDLMDIPVIRYVGFGAAVADAVDEAKHYADFVTTRNGGGGAVREVIEYVLKKTGKWQQVAQRYLQ